MGAILSILSNIISLSKSNKKNILIGLGLIVVIFWIKSFHYDKINNLQEKLDKNQEIFEEYNTKFEEYDANITTLESYLEKEKEICINEISKINQLKIKKNLQTSLKEVDNEKDNGIKTSVGSHALTFPK